MAETDIKEAQSLIDSLIIYTIVLNCHKKVVNVCMHELQVKYPEVILSLVGIEDIGGLDGIIAS